MRNCPAMSAGISSRPCWAKQSSVVEWAERNRWHADVFKNPIQLEMAPFATVILFNTSTETYNEKTLN